MDKHTLEIYTIQMGKWRDLKDTDIELFDITLKSGNQAFSPNPRMLGAYKRGEQSEDEFIQLYRNAMEVSFEEVPGEWEALVKKDKVALACYCSKEGFCHRYLLVNILMEKAKELNVSIIYNGEYVKPVVDDTIPWDTPLQVN